MLKRDRRWCQGNIQHLWLVFAKGWHPMSRVNFLHGILSYVSSLLWFFFLALSTYLAATPTTHSAPQSMLAEKILLGLTAMLIFLPKTVILLDEVITGRMFKPLKLRFLTFFSSLLDTIVFTLMAPVLMVFHARFVIYTLIGKSVSWVTQRRKIDGGVAWAEIIFTFASVTLLGLLWGVLGWFVSKAFLIWISPILFSLIVSILVAAVVSGGRSGKRLGIFLTPEEYEPPTVLKTMQQNLEEIKDRLQLPPELERHYGLMQVCLDPFVNGLHVSLLRRRRTIDVSRSYLDEIGHRLIKQGPQSLNAQELKALMHDTDTVTNLHYRIWSAADHELAPFWATAIRQYNLASTSPFAHTLAKKEVA
jgi:membrane glycosyltransferase